MRQLFIVFMMTVYANGPLVYITDDEDDQVLFRQAVLELGFTNQLRLFSNGMDMLTYLQTTTEQPLLILSDINMPLMNGLELRQHIEENDELRQKAIPFLFYTVQAGPATVKQAYKHTIQGFYTKEVRYQDFKAQIHLLVTYWQSCLHPNSFRD